MKTRIALLIAVLLLLSGCSAQIPEYERPVQFYYCAVESNYAPDSTAIAPETRECAALYSTEAILRAYLAGPQSEGLRTPFPPSLRLVDFSMDADVACITLSQELSTLNNLELTLSCGCITMTVLELTGAQAVRIRAENALLNGQETITMDVETLQLLDTAAEG